MAETESSPFIGQKKAWKKSAGIPTSETSVGINEFDQDSQEMFNTMEEVNKTFEVTFGGLKEPELELDQGLKMTTVEQQEAQDLKVVAKETRDGILAKISEQLGSNEGGWYENKETKERYYVKFYKNSDQARVEFIANAIYKKLGVHAVHSQLFEMNGKLAIASEAIQQSVSVTKEEMQENADVKKGFVADAYLANWDVVGLVYDNIVKGSDGRAYRIDNGGSLIFRAQGGLKEFSADHIAEFKTMRHPNYPAGQVFRDITPKDIEAQSRHLVDSLSDETIEQIISDSGLQGDAAETIRDGLKGRRDWLQQEFG